MSKKIEFKEAPKPTNSENCKLKLPNRIKVNQYNRDKAQWNECTRVRPGRLGLRSTVNCAAVRELLPSLVASMARESPTFPIIRSWP